MVLPNVSRVRVVVVVETDKEYVMKIKSFFVYVLTALCALNITGLKSAHAALILAGNDPVHIAMGAGRDYVGAISRGNDSSSLSFAGSITLIDDGAWGLTAKHVVLDNFSDPSSTFQFYTANFGKNYLTDSGITFNVQDVFVHPTQDLALIYFGNPVAGINPVQRFTGNVAVGTEGYNTGFGDREYVNDTNPAEFTGDRRAGFDVIQTVSGGVFRTSINESFEPSYREFEMGARRGDSGGAFIVELELDLDNDGTPDFIQRELLGIMAGASIDNLYGARTFYQIQDNAWIDTTKATVTAVPEPSSFILLASFLTGSGLFRKKFRLHKKSSTV